MIRVYSAADLLLVGHLRNLLDSAGIDCEIRNQNLAGAAGELPPTECWPELWLADAHDLPRARKLLEQALHDPLVVVAPWRCPECGENLEGQFTQCWRCGAQRPSSQD